MLEAKGAHRQSTTRMHWDSWDGHAETTSRMILAAAALCVSELVPGVFVTLAGSSEKASCADMPRKTK